MQQMIAETQMDYSLTGKWYPPRQSAWPGSLCKSDAANVQPVVSNIPSAKHVRAICYSKSACMAEGHFQ